MENTAELILKFDLDDDIARDKFDAILNSYNYFKLFTEFRRALIKKKNIWRNTAGDNTIDSVIVGLEEALDLFDVLSDKYNLVR